MRFQNQVFPRKITFDGEKFGTTDLSLIYKLNQENGANKSNLVRLVGIEPTTHSLKGRCSTDWAIGACLKQYHVIVVSQSMRYSIEYYEKNNQR